MPEVLARGHAKVTLGKYEGPPTAPSLAATAPLHIPVVPSNPVQDQLPEFVRRNLDLLREHDLDVVLKGTQKGRSLAICGAGPSLQDATISTFAATQDIWACNSALPYLTRRGIPVGHGVGIDQTPGLLREWSDPPDVTYLLASSVDPALVEHLIAHGRRIQFFHSMVGIPDELETYKRWPSTLMCHMGWSVTSRVLALAPFVGYERIDIHGADCSFGPGDMAHANGEHADDAYNRPNVSSGVVNGREYRTRPDMLMDAVHLARTVQMSCGTVRLIGDTLPVQLLGKDNAFLDTVCRRLAPGETVEPMP